MKDLVIESILASLKIGFNKFKRGLRGRRIEVDIQSSLTRSKIGIRPPFPPLNSNGDQSVVLGCGSKVAELDARRNSKGIPGSIQRDVCPQKSFRRYKSDKKGSRSLVHDCRV